MTAGGEEEQLALVDAGVGAVGEAVSSQDPGVLVLLFIPEL